MTRSLVALLILIVVAGPARAQTATPTPPPTPTPTPAVSSLGEGVYPAVDVVGYTGGWAASSTGMTSTTAGDTLELTFMGSGLVLYRTLSPTASDIEVCVDATCEVISNYADETVTNYPVGWYWNDVQERTATLTTLGPEFTLNSVFVLAADEQLASLPLDPAKKYRQIGDSDLIARDYSISNGELLIATLLSGILITQLVSIAQRQLWN